MLPTGHLGSEPASVSQIKANYLLQTADKAYTRRDFYKALILYGELFELQADDNTASRLLLTSLRTNDLSKAADLLSKRPPTQSSNYTYSFLTLYARTVLGLAEYDPKADRHFHYVWGAGLIDAGRFDDAVSYYQKLARIDDEVGADARRLSQRLGEHPKISHKHPWLAVSLSAVLPGLGQAYTEHYADAGMTLFWNVTFLGGSAYLYNLENQAGRPHHGSVIAGVFGLIFYATNLAGAYSSAHRRNIFMQRQFAREIRTDFFSIDQIERSSRIEFTRPFQFE